MQHLSFLWITQNNIKAQSFIQLISRMIYWTWCVWFLLEAKSKMKFKKNSCDLLWEMPVQYGEEVRDDEKIPSNWAAVLTTVKKRMLECYIGSVLDPGQFQERFGQAIRNPQAPNSHLRNPLSCRNGAALGSPLSRAIKEEPGIRWQIQRSSRSAECHSVLCSRKRE